MAANEAELSKTEVEESDHNSYNVNFRAHRPGISLEETIQCYDEWARKGTYEYVSIFSSIL